MSATPSATDAYSAISLRNLNRTFMEGTRAHTVLSGANAEFAAGETIALRGRSGSGKSTLLNLISGIDTPNAGSVTVANVELTALDEHARTLFRRQHIGFVYQSFNLVPTLNVGDNIRLVLELNGQRAREADRRIDELLDAVGLADRASSYPDVLSGGEQQRVAIARALCHRPAVLLADEPTGNLDDATAESILPVLTRLVDDTGSTLIMATHSNAIAATCDRTFELQQGRLVEQ